ncbi:LamG domain-containing protein [Corallococcus exiguus]|uniref:LamG domain-containing protein n=1 Tax=Corallococcus exiguus TaxID=83462 RepID=UPI00201699CE|nr:LamG domain-containing protein [Corallococcus exiguus]
MRPMYQYGAADVRYGQRIQLGTSTPINNSGTSSYSIGFWVRPRTPAYDGLLLSMGTDWSIGLHGMQLTLDMPGLNAPRCAEVELLPDQWQYILYVWQWTGTGAGNYTLYANGTPVIEGSATGVIITESVFTLGGTTDAQFCNVAFWSTAFTGEECQPVWDVPPPGPSLTACYSFSDGSHGDVSGHNRPAATFQGGAHVTMLAPALRVVNAAVQPSPRDNLTVVANGGPFSVQAWFNADAPSDFQLSDRTLFACRDRDTRDGIALGLGWDNGAFDVCLKSLSGSSGASWEQGAALPAGGWHHLSMTYDGSATVRLFLDGDSVAAISTTLPSVANPVWVFGADPDASVAGGAVHDFQGHLQAVSLWSRELPQNELQQYMSSDPSDADGCVAYYAWNALGLANQVTGNPPSLLNTATPSLVATPPSDSTPPPGAPSTTTLVAVPRPSAGLQPSVRWATEEVALPAQSPLSREQVDALIASYEQVLTSVPGAMKDRLRSLFRNNLHLGLSRGNGPGGLPVGTIAGKVEGKHYVFYHHTAQGPVECDRMELAVDTECIGWVISVASTCVCLLLAVVGLGYSATQVVKAARPLITESTSLLRTLGAAAQQGAIDGSTVIRIIKALYMGGTLGKIFGAALTGSWFTIALNCASLILMVVGLFTTGGAYLAVVLAQLVLNIAVLIAVIAQKPSNCC